MDHSASLDSSHSGGDNHNDKHISKDQRLLTMSLSSISDELKTLSTSADLPENRKNQKKKLPAASIEPKLAVKVAPKIVLSPNISKFSTHSDTSHSHTTEMTGDWPLELILVRHGQSEGNEAVKRSKKGDLSAYTPEFKNKHSSSYRLTDKGIEQAKVAGKWIKENIATKFDRYYTSEYVRAMETAALLDLPEAKWFTEIALRERDKGLLDNVSWIERHEKFGDEMARRKRDAFFWSPPGGESMANICNRIDHTFNTLRRECSNKRVIIVCHGEVMWGFRVRLERLSQIRYHQLSTSKDTKEKMRNGQILHYSRVNPVTGEVFPFFRFMRSLCPHKPEETDSDWMEFERPIYTNEELVQSVSTVPRYVNNEEVKGAPKKEEDEEVDY